MNFLLAIARAVAASSSRSSYIVSKKSTIKRWLAADSTGQREAITVGTPETENAVDKLRNPSDIFAHSMGTFLTMEGFVQGAQSGRTANIKRLQNVMLAAPDIDLDLFKTQIAQVKFDKSKIFILISKDDSALNFSRRISGGVDRVGAADAQELAELGVTVVDLSEIDDSASGSHSKFAGSPEVVQLIGRGLQSNRLSSATRTSLGDLLAGAPIPIIFTP